MGKRELDAAEALLGLTKRWKGGEVTERLPEGAFEVLDRTNMIVRCIASHPPETENRDWERVPNGTTPCPRCLTCTWQVVWMRDGSVRCMACSFRRF
jgi:hypothetical protein